MKWDIEQTKLFEKNFKKIIPKDLQKKVKEQILKLQYNPFNSKPLGFKFFREKRIKKWRIYFLIYEKVLIINFISISNKKLQQKTINGIKTRFKFLKSYIEEKYKNRIT